jgi:DNA-binding response OmpR family regulator
MSEDGRELSVLIVDDDAALRRFLITALELEGFATVGATNGQEALTAMEEHEPDVILLDVMMPVLDGWGVLSVIRANPENDARVIMVSANATRDAQLQAWELGCDDYLTKPVDLGVLLKRITEVARLSKPEAEHRRLQKVAELFLGGE